MAKSTNELVAILGKYFPGDYNPQTKFINELSLAHAVEITSAGGGEQALNDANTKVLVGVSDFNGTQLPADAKGLLSKISVKYATAASAATGFAADPAGQVYSEVKSDAPAWLLNSEIVVRSANIEHIRMRVSETMLLDKARTYPSNFAKELEKTIKVVGNQDLQIFLSTPKGSTLASAKHFVRVDLYGLKFGERKGN